VERDAGKKARDGSGQVRVDWMYVGGFFDGEGGVSVAARAWSNTLALKVTMGQKSQGILKKIQHFFLPKGFIRLSTDRKWELVLWKSEEWMI